MQIRPDSAAHLTYCTNVHPGESWPDTFARLSEYLPAVKQQVSPQQPFGVGLRLSAEAAAALRAPDELAAFTDWLGAQGLYVFTLNGFPYGRFHGAPVKDRVYAPDWRSTERLDYTRNLVAVLSALLPHGMRGSISTVPLSYKPWFDSPQTLGRAREDAADRLAAVAMELWQLEQETGQCIRLGLEPEPDGLLEDTSELCDFVQRELTPAMRRHAGVHGVPGPRAEELARRYIGICLDTCHASVQFERPDVVLSRLRSAGVGVTKVQVSSALRLAHPHRDTGALRARLESLCDPVYLHQVRARRDDGRIAGFRDLPEALASAAAGHAAEWRIHFHVPVFLPGYDGLASTHEETAEALRLCIAAGDCDHFEIETYTWDVLPAALRSGLADSISREFAWTREAIG